MPKESRSRMQKWPSSTSCPPNSTVTGTTHFYPMAIRSAHVICAQAPSIETLERWASALEVEVYQLFFEGEGKPEPVPVGAMEALDKSEEKLLGFFRRANEADRQFMLQVGRKL